MALIDADALLNGNQPIPSDGGSDADQGAGSLFLHSLTSETHVDYVPPPTGDLSTDGAWLPDFNGDGLSDILLDNTGVVGGGVAAEIWTTDTTSPYSFTHGPQNQYFYDASPIGTTAVGDFDGDGKADILWSGDQNGPTLALSSEPGTVAYPTASNSMVLSDVHSPWTLDGIGDFNGDGLADIVWQDPNYGASTIAFSVWLTTAPSSPGAMPTFVENSFVNQVPMAWGAPVIGDFSGDGKDDLLFHNGTTDQISIWSSTGSSFTPNTYVGQGPDSTWSVIAVGDFTGDGKDDLLWRNGTTGQISVWDSTGSGFTENVYVNNVPTNWQPFVGDYNGDGKADILWYDQTSHDITIWNSNGSGFDTNAFVDTELHGTGFIVLA